MACEEAYPLARPRRFSNVLETAGAPGAKTTRILGAPLAGSSVMTKRIIVAASASEAERVAGG